MKILVFIAIILFASTTARKTHKRYHDIEATANYENVEKNDRGNVGGLHIVAHDYDEENLFRANPNVDSHGHEHHYQNGVPQEYVSQRELEHSHGQEQNFQNGLSQQYVIPRELADNAEDGIRGHSFQHGNEQQFNGQEQEYRHEQNSNSEISYKSNPHFHIPTGFRFSALNATAHDPSNRFDGKVFSPSPKDPLQSYYVQGKTQDEAPRYNTNAESSKNGNGLNEYVYITEDHNQGQHEDPKGYSFGSGLRSIAQGSANKAHAAVSNQHVAAQQAAYLAKNTFAKSAYQAAATANAALAGKQVLVNSLEKQTAEAHRALEREIDQLKLAKDSASVAKSAAEQAIQHVSALHAAIIKAQGVAEHTETAVKSVATELASQTNMVSEAKTRLKVIESKLHSARRDYGATKEAAGKAAAAAEEAQQNASSIDEQASYYLREFAEAHLDSGPSKYEYSESHY